MKKVLIVLFIILGSIQGRSQDGPFDYSEVVQADSISKEDLFAKATEWFAKTYKSSNEVIQLSDAEQGKIVGKGVFNAYVMSLGSLSKAGYVHYTITISVKEGRYMYNIDNVYHDGHGSFSSCGALNNSESKGFMVTKKQWSTIKEEADKQIKALILMLKSEMNKKELQDW